MNQRRYVGKPVAARRRHAILVFLIVFAPLAAYATVSPEETRRGAYPQGWPWVYLERRVQEEEEGVWFLWRGVQQCSVPMLLADLGVAALLACAISVCWHVHTARRRPWQLSLFEILCITGMVAGVFSCRRAYYLAYEEEQRIIKEIEAVGWVVGGNMGVPTPLVRPLVDAGILPTKYLWRTRGVAWDAEDRVYGGVERVSGGDMPWADVDEMLHDIAPKIELLRHCDTIEIYDSELTDTGVATICNKVSICRYARLQASRNLTDMGLAYVVDLWPNLRELELYGTGITDEGMGFLKALPQLSFLAVEDAPHVSVDGRYRVADIPALELAYLPRDWVEDKSLVRALQARGIRVE